MKTYFSLEERQASFWVKVNKTDTCWLWTAATTNGGYGVVNHRGVISRAHRLAWEWENGPVPTGMQMCHHCDNPKCVRPSHLFIGTAKENMEDMARKGRSNAPKGERCYTAKISDAEATDIRQRFAAGGISKKRLAEEYGLHSSHVGRIINGRKRAINYSGPAVGRLIQIKRRGYYRKKGEENQVVLCECGCKTEISKYDNYGRPRKFVSGHNGRRCAHTG